MRPITRIIDHHLYPRKTISAARQAYKDYCLFKIEPINDEKARLTIIVQPEYEAQQREIVLEFLNFVLDKAAEAYLSEQ